MSIIHEDLEPGVIDTAMLNKAVSSTFPKGEAGRLAALDGIVLETVRTVRLEYLNILKIDHLWMLTSLVKLQIGNNIIEKIENLDALVKLKELDLSFNNIEVIENLDKLVLLETLSLYQNQISKLENLDHLENLMIFSIGNNQLTEHEPAVMYVRLLPKLRSLNMDGNPCCAQQYFQEFVVAYLPKLMYYAYRLIRKEERDRARGVFIHQIRKLEEIDAEKEKIRQAELEEAREVALYSEAFLEYLNSDQLFKSLFVDDPNGKAFLLMSEEAEEAYTNYEEEFNKTVQELFKFGLEHDKLRKDETHKYRKCVDKARMISVTKSREIVEDFLETKVGMFAEVRKLMEAVEEQNEYVLDECFDKIQRFSDKYHDNCQTVWQELMSLEMVLFEQMEDTNSSFERNMTDLVNTFNEGSQEFFVQCRMNEVTFNEAMQEHSNRYMTNINVRMDDPLLIIPQELKSIMVDKEALNIALSTSHDLHLSVIDKREDVLATRSRAWVKEMCSNLEEEEVKRNRARVTELNNFLDIQREEYEELQFKLADDDIMAPS